MGCKDIISKQIVRHLAVDLATYLLKLEIDVRTKTEVPSVVEQP